MYPSDYFARGITRPECIIGDKIQSCVFDFDKDIKPNGYREMSIVWLINESSIEYAKKQKNKKGDVQFKLGFAVVHNSDLSFLIDENNGKLNHHLDHEPHGLITSNLDKINLKRISQHLAECSKFYSYSDDLPLGTAD